MKRFCRPHPKYALMAADLLSDLGNQFLRFTLMDRMVFGSDGAVLHLLALCLLEQAPSIFLGPFAGKWIDRRGAGKWLTFVGRGRCLLAAALLMAAGPITALAAYLGCIVGGLFFTIGRLSQAPALVPREELPAYNALNERIALAGAVIGPVAICPVIALAGHRIGLGLAALLFWFTSRLCARMPRPERKNTVPAHEPWKKPGKRRRPLPGPSRLWLAGFSAVAGGTIGFGLPIFFKSELHGGIAQWGWVMAGFQAGAMAGTFAPVGGRLAKSPEIALAGCFGLCALAVSILPAAPSAAIAAGLMIPVGTGFSLIQIMLESLIQQQAKPSSMGKTMAGLCRIRSAAHLGAATASAGALALFSPPVLLYLGALILAAAACATPGFRSRHASRACKNRKKTLHRQL